MELPSELLEQIVFNTRTKTEEHMLIVMDESKYEKRLSQPPQTNNKQFKIALTFPNVYSGHFKVTKKNNKFYFTASLADRDSSIRIIIAPGAY